jgi:hypothetical protein
MLSKNLAKVSTAPKISANKDANPEFSYGNSICNESVEIINKIQGVYNSAKQYSKAQNRNHKITEMLKEKDNLASAINILTYLKNNRPANKRLAEDLCKIFSIIQSKLDELSAFDYLFDDQFLKVINDVYFNLICCIEDEKHPFYNIFIAESSLIVKEDVDALLKLLSIISDIEKMLGSANPGESFAFIIPRADIEWIAAKHLEIISSPHLKTQLIAKRKLHKAINAKLGCILPVPITLPNLTRLHFTSSKYNNLCTAINTIEAFEKLRLASLLPDDNASFAEPIYNSQLFAVANYLNIFSQQLSKQLIALLEENFPHMPWAIIASLEGNWGEIISRGNSKGFSVSFTLSEKNLAILKSLSLARTDSLDINWYDILDELSTIKAMLKKLRDEYYANPNATFLKEQKKQENVFQTNITKCINPPYIFWHKQEIEIIKNSCFAFMLELPEWKKVVEGRGLLDAEMYNLLENLIDSVEEPNQVQVLKKIKQTEANFLAYQVRRWEKKLPQNGNVMLTFVQKVMQACPTSRNAWKNHFTGHNRKIQLSTAELTSYKGRICNDNELNQYIDKIFDSLKPSVHQKLYEHICSIESSNYTVENASSLAIFKQLTLFGRVITAYMLGYHNHIPSLKVDDLIMKFIKEHQSLAFAALEYALCNAVSIFKNAVFEEFNEIVQSSKIQRDVQKINAIVSKIGLTRRFTAGNERQMLSLLMESEIIHELDYALEKCMLLAS